MRYRGCNVWSCGWVGTVGAGHFCFIRHTNITQSALNIFVHCINGVVGADCVDGVCEWTWCLQHVADTMSTCRHHLHRQHAQLLQKNNAHLRAMGVRPPAAPLVWATPPLPGSWAAQLGLHPPAQQTTAYNPALSAYCTTQYWAQGGQLISIYVKLQCTPEGRSGCAASPSTTTPPLLRQLGNTPQPQHYPARSAYCTA
jgi:hypothetical protein